MQLPLRHPCTPWIGFLRFSELCSIRACDVRLYTSHFSLFLESSKTDQLREGVWINIARSGKVTCPVAVLERYRAAAGIKLDEDFLLFRALAPPQSSAKVRQHSISYTRAREIVKEAFKDITDVSKISLHSLVLVHLPGSPIVYSNVMADGQARMQRTVMLRAIWALCCLFLVR